MPLRARNNSGDRTTSPAAFIAPPTNGDADVRTKRNAGFSVIDYGIFTAICVFVYYSKNLRRNFFPVEEMPVKVVAETEPPLRILEDVGNKWESFTQVEKSDYLSRVSKNVQHDVTDEIEFYWQPPSESWSDPLAVVLLAHGCGHQATDWWPRDNVNCIDCIGLPEEMAIVDIVRKLNMVAVAVSSSNTEHRCWGPQDGPRILTVLEQFTVLFPDSKILAFGASSGGAFVSKILPRFLGEARIRFDGYISQISAPKAEADMHVPAGFILMSKDDFTIHNLERFRKQYHAPLKQIILPPPPITPSFFYDRIPAISEQLSMEMSQALQDDLLLGSDGTLRDDPRENLTWKHVLQPFVASIGDTLVADHSAVAEVMNVAYGFHEMTRDGVEICLRWLMSETLKIEDAEVEEEEEERRKSKFEEVGDDVAADPNEEQEEEEQE